jgi:hypothetical protein
MPVRMLPPAKEAAWPAHLGRPPGSPRPTLPPPPVRTDTPVSVAEVLPDEPPEHKPGRGGFGLPPIPPYAERRRRYLEETGRS